MADSRAVFIGLGAEKHLDRERALRRFQELIKDANGELQQLSERTRADTGHTCTTAAAPATATAVTTCAAAQAHLEVVASLKLCRCSVTDLQMILSSWSSLLLVSRSCWPATLGNTRLEG